MKTIKMLEDHDPVQADDWCRPLRLESMDGGRSDIYAFKSTYSGRPINNVKWVRVQDVFGPCWFGRPAADLSAVYPTEFIRGAIPVSHQLVVSDTIGGSIDANAVLSFHGWSNMGFTIRKGSKAIGFTAEGQALFGAHQVYRRGKAAPGATAENTPAESEFPSDHDHPVYDENGNYFGRVIYKRAVSGKEPERHTVFPDGSGVMHGLMGGDVYYNEHGD